MSRAAPPHDLAPAARRRRLAFWAIVLVALLPSWGTLAAPWIADDGVVLGYVHRGGWLRDWWGPQYDLVTVTFWRPLVTTSWGIQETLFGVEPAPFRALNLFCHVIFALGAAGIARALGLSGVGAALVGLLAATHPDQGGTVTWVAGRVDAWTAPWFVGALWAALRRRPLLAALLAFGACASKETAFCLPGWAAVLGFVQVAEGHDAGALDLAGRSRRAATVTLPVLGACVAAFLWRRWALGAWIGGYPTESGGPAAAGHFLSAWGGAAAPTLIGVAVLGLVGAWTRSLAPARLGAGLVCGLGAALPLFALLADGHLEPQNQRALLFADLGLCLAAGAALGRAAVRAPWFGLWVGLALVGVRGTLAFMDTHEWAAAGAAGEAALERARSAAEVAGPGEPPLFYDGFPSVYEGAYALGFGVVDRQRAPFPAAARPVWPDRPLFGDPASRRAPVHPVHDGFTLPEATERTVGALRVSAEDGSPVASLTVDERVPSGAEDRSPAVVIDTGGEGELELVLYTEMGYEPFPWGPAVDPARRRLSLTQAFLSGNGRATMADAVILSASLGARNAYLEVRRLVDGRVVAASDWIELVWEPAVLDLAR